MPVSLLVQLYNQFRQLRSYYGREEGATMVEYGLIVVFIAVVVAVAAQLLGGGISDLFETVDTSIDPSDGD